jgi:integrase
MSIWADKDGRFHVGIMVAGHRVHRILPEGSTKSDAKQLEAELRGAVVRRKQNVPGDPPLAKVMELYMEHAETLRGAQSAKYHALRLAPWVVKYKASEAKRAANHFIKDCRSKYAPATINWSLSTLKKALTLAHDQGRTPVNYADEVPMMKVANQRDVTLTLEQVRKLADAASEQVRAAVWIAIYSGCRRGEILKMQAADISKDSMLIHSGNTKTLKTRTIPIVKPLRPWLKYVPLQINAEGLKTGFQRARVKAELEHVTFHDLRRSCATLMIQAGVDLYVVSKLLGHSSVTVTQQRYGHLQVDRIAEGLKRTFE